MESRNCVGFLESFVSDFFDIFCQPVSPPNDLALLVLLNKSHYLTTYLDPLEVEVNNNKVTYTGSAVEFYINLPLSCIEDIDLMVATPGIAAIPEGCAKIRNRNDDEIFTLVPVDNHPGFVLVGSVSEQILSDNRVKRNVGILKNSTIIGNQFFLIMSADGNTSDMFNKRPSAAVCAQWFIAEFRDGRTGARIENRQITTDFVFSIPCPVWPIEAREWETRKRRCGWPSETTIRQITLGGCDVIPVAHRDCKHDTHQWRLSFSRAEMILLNSYTRVQQIVYHMLRFASNLN